MSYGSNVYRFSSKKIISKMSDKKSCQITIPASVDIEVLDYQKAYQKLHGVTLSKAAIIEFALENSVDFLKDRTNRLIDLKIEALKQKKK